MKVSELIKELERYKDMLGDLDIYYKNMDSDGYHYEPCSINIRDNTELYYDRDGVLIENPFIYIGNEGDGGLDLDHYISSKWGNGYH